MARKALIVGINHYPNQPLGGCINDANLINEVLSFHENENRNFETKLLTSDTNEITTASLRGELEDFFDSNCEAAVFFFAGHGDANKNTAYLVTPELTVGNLGVTMEELLHLANESKIRNKIIILDCCYAGNAGTPITLGTGGAPIFEGVTILAATRAHQAATETATGGVFTSLVYAALKGGAADVRGHITPGSVYSYVDQALGEFAQRPIFKTNIERFISLREAKAPLSDSILRKLAQYFPDADSEHLLNPSYEDTNDPKAPAPQIKEPIANPENVKIFKDLQKFVSNRLVEPVGNPFMYYAAMESLSCKLTPTGKQYWEMVKKGKI